MRSVLALTLLACGARTDLSASPKHQQPPDAGVAPPEPCFDVAYDSDGAIAAVPFVLTATHVYYVRYRGYHDELVRVVKAGGTPELVRQFNDMPNGRVLVDETSVYWTQGIQVLTAAIMGNQPTKIGQVPSLLGGVMAQNDASLVLRVDPGSLASLPKAGGDWVALAPPNAPTGPAVDAYADASRAYWSTGEHVYAMSLAPPFTLVTYGAWPTGLAIDEAHVYWATTTNGTDAVHVTNKDDASSDAVLEGHARGPIAVGNDAVFGAAPHAASGIVKVPMSGGPETLVAPGVVPIKLATDATCVYYATLGPYVQGQLTQKIARLPQ